MSKRKKQWLRAGIVLAVIVIAAGVFAYFNFRDAETLNGKLDSVPSTVLVGYLENEDRYIKLAEVNTAVYDGAKYNSKLRYKLDADGNRIKDAEGKAIREEDPDGNEQTNFFAFYSKERPGEEVRVYSVCGTPEEAAGKEGFAGAAEETAGGKAGRLGSKEEGGDLILGFFVESPYPEISVAATVTMRGKEAGAGAAGTAEADGSGEVPGAEADEAPGTADTPAEDRAERARGILEAVMLQITPEKQMAAIAKDFYQNFIQDNRWTFLTNGLLVTLEITLFAVLLGIAIGVLVAVARSTWDQISETLRPGVGRTVLAVINGICKCYLTVIRGTPVVVQLMIIYYVIFRGAQNGALIGALAFGINSGAYVAEIIRGGVMSVDRGQMEAGRSLGFNYVQTMWYIIVPQALKSVLPALANEFIVLLKETSVAGYVAVMDLTKGGETIRGLTYSPFMPLLAVALIYLVVVMFFTWLVGKLERRLRSSDH